jgi:hypothetical protein
MIRIFFACLALGTVAVAASPSPTFNKDVLPILQKNCQSCHRPGEIGPSSFLTYENTRPWAKAIKGAVINRKMPPWFAEPQYGHFRDDRRLSDADIQTLVSWADSGAAEGDAKDKPAAVQWLEGWNIKPDLVFKMPKPYIIPASGTIEYTYIVVPSGLTKDTWVTAGEIRPGNRSAVHHVIAFVRPKGSLWMKDAQPGVPYVPPNRRSGGAPPAAAPGPRPSADAENSDLGNEFLVGYTPGMQPQPFDIDNSAKLIPAGADIVFEVHYTTNGKSGEDQTQVGLTLAKEPPKKRFYSFAIASPGFAIPPGDPNYEGHAAVTFSQPVRFVYMQPHMHLRGKDMTVKAVYPTGESEKLLSVPHYDFNWQVVYYEEQPLDFPKGTRVELTAHWDNSPNNKWNPDPSQTVRWGDQSWDEMLVTQAAVIIDKDVDPRTITARRAPAGGARE